MHCGAFRPQDSRAFLMLTGTRRGTMKLDTREAAKRMSIAAKTLDNWRSLGTGPPFYKLGGRVVYDDGEVDAWLAARRRTSTADPGAAAQSAA